MDTIATDHESSMEAFIAIEDDESGSDPTLSTEEEERDEVKEIIRLSSKETFRVRTWRAVVAVALLLTALAVTITTFFFLKQAEQTNFRLAYEQFSRTVADAAISEQRDLRQSMRGLSHAITAYTESTNVNWPYFYMPKFEALGQDFKDLSRAELVGINNIVYHHQRESYIEWATRNYADWTKEAHLLAYGNTDKLNTNTSRYNQFISKKGPNGFVPDDHRERYFVRTTMSPPPRAYGPVINWNTGGNASRTDIGWALENSVLLRNETFISMVRAFRGLPPDEHLDLHTDDSVDHPHSFVYYPIHNRIADDSEVVGTITAVIAWDAAMRKLLPKDVKGICCVIRNTCNQTFTYEIEGHDAIYMGDDDLHDKKYDDFKTEVDLALHTHPNFSTTPGHCMFSMTIYPSRAFEQNYVTSMPRIHAIVVAFAFLLVFLMFCIYDIFVQRRNKKLVFRAAQTNAIVTSIFPGDLPSRLLAQKSEKSKNHQTLRKFLSNGSTSVESITFESKPLADLFLDTTVLFADIVGFTAWSSVREPTQVFRLLETVYSAFDRIAKHRRVFKVETVGDCYVAVCGLPHPRVDHATTMIRFARDIMKVMHVVTKKLEIILGPDTGDLSIRVGIHSGPVTGGVLRGERSRFQLFGDTMNTAARIESTSMSGRIQISLETAKLVIKAGKEDWIRKRKDMVAAKGKGEIETYWVSFDGNPNGSSSSEHRSLEADDLLDWNEQIASRAREVGPSEDDRNGRLIDWNVETLLRLLRQIVARRNALVKYGDPRAKRGYLHNGDQTVKARMPLEEVKEIITLPKFNSRAAREQQDPERVMLSCDVISQLQDYVTCIANMYRNNPFHNFSHASHVVMSVNKLMTRIVAPDNIGLEDEIEAGAVSADRSEIAATLHDHTYGITSDPLTQFACAFSALIHDVDHMGVPNMQLIQENQVLASRYKNRSVAEQNSFDLSWDLLMKERYTDLRRTICSTKAELVHFRQLVINSVMATDLGDKELKALRNARWDKAFKNDIKGEGRQISSNKYNGSKDNSARDDANRKATIVIEHLIQASDVSHTMQHWHIYRKWNECLFAETFNAYLDGRCEIDPREVWYKGEIGFFDFYVIPLAKKLKNCGVFGISSDEYLNYAMTNREEWEKKGRLVVAGMIEKMERNAIDDFSDETKALLRRRSERNIVADITEKLEKEVAKTDEMERLSSRRQILNISRVTQ